ncbi:MAG: hypothetical protein L0287_18560 [Anaerolineae bacterium]|nr:hypothetical protein [Anaerolineae bacterium]MCI0608073.1 hypothetical protein [Anaerolineae bacterium]
MAVTFAWIAVLMILVTSVGLLLVRDWRLSIIFLAVQYLGMFILILQHWPLGMASVKVVAGWMAAAILGMTRSGLSTQGFDEESIWPRGRLFRLFAAGIVGLIVPAVTPSVSTIMADAGFAVTGGSLLLIGMGLLHLGITVSILRVTIGLMTVLSGFEIIYSAVEGSVLVAALLAIINLGLALAGSYLLIASASSEAA